MAVTLTFDNGPYPGVTAGVLDTLAAHGVKASFFVVGDMLMQPGARDLAERAVADGHWIGNHSLSHRTPLGEQPGPEHAEREILGAEALIGDLAHPRRFFRPFGNGGLIGPHLLSEAAVDLLVDRAYTCVLWSCVPRDWEDPEGWVDTALAAVDRGDDPVVVLHDLPTGAMDHLDRFLSELERREVSVVQDFPASVVPIEQGQRRDLTGLVAAS